MKTNGERNKDDLLTKTIFNTEFSNLIERFTYHRKSVKLKSSL